MGIIWGIVQFVLLIGIFAGILYVSDFIVDLAIRIFPELGKWLDNLPLSK